jgi:predicted DNA-binding WGR domain protein
VASGPVDPVADALRDGIVTEGGDRISGLRERRASVASRARSAAGRLAQTLPFSLCITSLNRSGQTDSQNLLDGMHGRRDIHIMQTKDVIHLRRIDPTRNMARFYRLSSALSLFGDICVVREWGRIGRPGRMRIDLYEKVEEAAAARHVLERAKRRRGYEDACAAG